VDKIKRAFESDKEYFLPGIKTFVNSFDKNVNTHAALLSAMMTFGKYSGINPKSIKPNLLGINIYNNQQLEEDVLHKLEVDTI